MDLVSLVIPAMDEEETIGECIRRARAVFEEMGIEGEVIVADSSGDATPEIAISLGAEVVRPIFTTSYGMRQFTIRDTNGYLLTFIKDIGDAA